MTLNINFSWYKNDTNIIKKLARLAEKKSAFEVDWVAIKGRFFVEELSNMIETEHQETNLKEETWRSYLATFC